MRKQVTTSALSSLLSKTRFIRSIIFSEGEIEKERDRQEKREREREREKEKERERPRINSCGISEEGENSGKLKFPNQLEKNGVKEIIANRLRFFFFPGMKKGPFNKHELSGVVLKT